MVADFVWRSSRCVLFTARVVIALSTRRNCANSKFKIRIVSSSVLDSPDANSKTDSASADLLRICICAQIGAADTERLFVGLFKL